MKIRLLGIVGMLVLGLQLSASALSADFTNGSGDGLWSTAINWTTGTLPTAVDRAKLAFVSTHIVTLDSAGMADELLVGHVSTAGVHIVSGGTLVVDRVNLGAFTAGGVGTITMDAGTFDCDSNYRIGNSATVTGVTTLNAGTITVGDGVSVGYKGIGLFEMTGGSFNASGTKGFIIGDIAGSSGTATIGGGILSITNGVLNIGLNGNGTMNITGGSVLAKTIDINKSGAVGTDAQLNLLGGSLELAESYNSALEIGGDDALHIEGGTLIWDGDHLSDLDTLVTTNAITWANGQTMLGVYDVSWMNGTSILYADYNDINPGKTTVWAITLGSQSPYDEWAESFGVGGGPSADADGDKLSNLYEFGLGGNPTNSADLGYLSESSIFSSGGTNWLEFVHARRTTPDNGLTYSLEQVDDLVSGSWTNSGNYTEVDVGTLDLSFEWVTNRFDTAGKSQEFIRLIIE